MREILYRGINHETGKFVYGFYTKLLDGARITHNIIVEDEESEYRFTNFYIHSKGTIGQYTGLTDRNGTKIFEGDIINVPYNYIGKREVKYLGGAWSIHRYDIKKIEIMGNIHEADR